MVIITVRANDNIYIWDFFIGIVFFNKFYQCFSVN